MSKYEVTWKKTGVTDITAICYSCLEVKIRTIYNRSYKFRSLVKILTTNNKTAYQQNTRFLLVCPVSEDVFQPLMLHDSVINLCNWPVPLSVGAPWRIPDQCLWLHRWLELSFPWWTCLTSWNTVVSANDKRPGEQTLKVVQVKFIPIHTLHTSAPSFSDTDFNTTLSFYTYVYTFLYIFCARVNSWFI